MPVAMMIENPNVNEEIYEKVRAAVGLEKPAGGIVHIAGPAPTGGWRVIEVWESEEDAQRFFRERLFPAFQQVGVEPPPTQPQFWHVHNMM